MTNYTTHETGFYTLVDEPGQPPAGTLCEKCALQTLNLAFMIHGIEPAETLAEAQAALSMYLVLANSPLADGFVIPLGDHGTCQHCGAKA